MAYSQELTTKAIRKIISDLYPLPEWCIIIEEEFDGITKATN